MLKLIIFLAFISLSSLSFADVYLIKSLSIRAQQNEETEKIAVYIKGNKMISVSSNPKSPPYTLIDLDSQKEYLIYPLEKKIKVLGADFTQGLRALGATLTAS